MHRLFVALRPPPPVRAALRGVMHIVPEARWQEDDQLHLTLRYIGQVDRPMAEDIAAAIGSVRSDPIEARLSGVGRFGKEHHAQALWAGVTPVEPLAALHRKVDRALIRLGLAPEGRAYLPHITLARLSRSAILGSELQDWLVANAAFASAPFRFEHLILYESHLGHEAARYEIVERWALG